MRSHIKIFLFTILDMWQSVGRAIFLEHNKYLPQVFLDECFYKT